MNTSLLNKGNACRFISMHKIVQDGLTLLQSCFGSVDNKTMESQPLGSPFKSPCLGSCAFGQDIYTLYRHCLVPLKGLRAISSLVACLQAPCFLSSQVNKVKIVLMWQCRSGGSRGGGRNRHAPPPPPLNWINFVFCFFHFLIRMLKNKA